MVPARRDLAPLPAVWHGKKLELLCLAQELSTTWRALPRAPGTSPHLCAVMMPAFIMFMCSPPTGSYSLQAGSTDGRARSGAAARSGGQAGGAERQGRAGRAWAAARLGAVREPAARSFDSSQGLQQRG